MNGPITINLPFPPSVNGYWRNVVMGEGPKVSARTLISKKGREYRDEVVKQCCSEQITGLRLGARLSVTLVLHPPCKRKRDVDNYAKALLDALSHAQVWGDDSQVDVLVVERGANVKGGAVMVRIEELDALRVLKEVA